MGPCQTGLVLAAIYLVGQSVSVHYAIWPWPCCHAIPGLFVRFEALKEKG